MLQSQQDELSQLFSSKMNFSQPLPQYPTTPDKQFFTQQQDQPQIVYSSQHYTGTYHICLGEPTEEPRADSRVSVPTPSHNLDETLRRNNIDPASLSTSQIKLIINADYEQRLRLLELWRISPPEPGSQGFSGTSMAQEEEMARLRYEKRIESEQQTTHSHDAIGADSQEAEPYVLSGYAQRIDPVYAAATGMWQAQNYSQAMQTMDAHYGAFQENIHARNFGVDVLHDEMVM